MRGIRIRDMSPKGFLAFDLRDLLRVAGARAVTSQWICSGVWATPKECAAGNPLERFAEARQPVSGRELAAAADQTQQVIDGLFTAVEHGSEPWLRIEAIDSSCWEVFTSDEELLGRMRATFSATEDLPQSAA
jgi:hypothetical protein